MKGRNQNQLELKQVIREESTGDVDTVRLETNDGVIDCRLHPAPGSGAAVIWVGGAGGGLSGPARGLYPRLASQLATEGIASLRLDYRRPNDLTGCVLDTLVGAAFMQSMGYTKLVLVGHSFGGAVVINAGAHSDQVVGVAALSSQTYGADAVNRLHPRPLLLLHGTSDRVLPDQCSKQLYRAAEEPKEIKLYPGCGHGLDECQEAVDRDLRAWIERVLLDGKAQGWD